MSQREYCCTGSVVLSGVVFYITASSLEEATEKAADGKFDHYETGTAEAVDWALRTETVEENV